MPTTTPAEHLTCVRLNLLDAQTAARNAAEALAGSRAARATALVGEISNVLAYCERLQTVVAGDQRADEALR